MEDFYVFCGFFWKLIYDFYLSKTTVQNCNLTGAPRRGWDLWRFAALIPSGCRLPPIHKVMGDHASRGPIPAGAFAVMWQKRGMKTEWKRVVEKDKYGRKQMDRKKTRSKESKMWTLLWGGVRE